MSGSVESPQEKALQVGIAVRDITPPPGMPMWGYSDREGTATGTLDPLFAKAVVFRTEKSSAAVVTLDLGRPPLPPVTQRIRQQVQEKGVQDVAIMATHTHQGPVMESVDAPHILNIEKGIVEAIAEAAQAAQPARLAIARTTVDVAHNRRILTPDGRCIMLWRNEEKRPTEPVDKEMTLIRIDDLDGKPFGVLVNFACHPVVMGPSNLQFSADYCGELARIVKEGTGAECLFLQGGCGDINPYLDKTPIDEGGVESMRSVGRECAEAVLKALPQAKTITSETTRVAYTEKPVAVGCRFDLNNEKQMEVLRGMYGDAIEFYKQFMTPDLAVPLGVLSVNDEIAFAFMPGEIFVQYQLELKNMSPLRNTMLCGYANDFHAYFPTIRDAAAGGYGGLAATYVGVGAGDKLVMEACTEIGRQTGALKDLYLPEDFELIEVENA
ncbi:MAG: neutral/alkaline non-lysosomal ceramidase N-terminal domain-containing protein [Candidatus Hydrogenedentes bacterium]|nr:neutral/alkaline non-lysosomal ceramidase N-terminal domain-containing protein [Candidatus Hydrogenedentota bacterium]